MRHTALLLLGAAVLLAACDREAEKPALAPEPPPAPTKPAPAPASPPAPVGDFSFERLSRGAALYVEHCLQCHGPEGQGHPDWQTPSDGTFTAAPPVNGTGNVWKRSKQELMTVIRKGATRNGALVMPAYAGRLKDQEIESILT
ncbi:MAG: c-type cytochrome, partial [Acidiferrobacterales bacterium]